MLRHTSFPHTIGLFDRPEDSISAAYREELYLQTKLEDDDESVSVPSVVFQLIPIMLIISLGAWWYRQKKERRRSGHHKRIE
jgi:hypothetical protein